MVTQTALWKLLQVHGYFTQNELKQCTVSLKIAEKKQWLPTISYTVCKIRYGGKRLTLLVNGSIRTHDNSRQEKQLDKPEYNFICSCWASGEKDGSN